MADINQVQLPDGSQYNIKDSNSGYATESYVQDQISGITKATIGLGNVDNTSDMSKPVSTAQQTALNGKTNTSVIAYTESSATATKRYEIGDQFILSGVLYTATTIIPNGDPIVVDTNCSASDTIVEQLANISADDVAFDNTGTDLVSEEVESAIKEVNAKTSGLTRMTKLWENSSPSASFAGQAITLSSDDYDFLLWVYKEQASTSYYLSVMSPKGAGTSFELPDIGASGNSNRIRRVTYVDNTHFSFGGAFIGSSSTYTSDNSVMIPITTYGIKLI